MSQILWLQEFKNTNLFIYIFIYVFIYLVTTCVGVRGPLEGAGSLLPRLNSVVRLGGKCSYRLSHPAGLALQMFPVETNRYLSLLSEQKFLVPCNTVKLDGQDGQSILHAISPNQNTSSLYERQGGFEAENPRSSLLHLPMDLPEGPQRHFQQ